MYIKYYYVVHKGRRPGIYLTWGDCNEQVKGFPDAKFKKFSNLKAAEKALKHGWYDNYRKAPEKPFKRPVDKPYIVLSSDPIPNSICVDGSCYGWNRKVEFQAIDRSTRETIFQYGPFLDGTNQIAEFLALTTAIQYCHKHCIDLPIYSDSQTAINWVKKKKYNTYCLPTKNNAELLKAMDAAVAWLHQNKFSNQILKWHTNQWGENPADFGRK